MIRNCVVCGQEFKCSPSDKKVTCSKACSKINKSWTHLGKKISWSEESRERLKTQGQTANLLKGTEAAKASPKSGRFETNINAIEWHLVSPDGKHYHFRSLNHWLRENCEELFGCAPDSKQFYNVRSGLSGAKRAVLGGKYGSCTYKGWQSLPVLDARQDDPAVPPASNHAGVSWNKASRKWNAYISADGKLKYLGSFDDLNDAIAARKKAESARDLRKSQRRQIEMQKTSYQNCDLSSLTQSQALVFKDYLDGISAKEISERHGLKKHNVYRYIREARMILDAQLSGDPSALLKAKNAAKKYCQDYYQKNKDSIKAKTKEYYENHNEEIREYRKAYYIEHKEELDERNRSYSREYYEKNREKILARQKARRKENFDSIVRLYENSDLSSLSSIQALVFREYLSGISSREIAKNHNLKVHTVYRYIREAKAMLAPHFSENQEGT